MNATLEKRLLIFSFLILTLAITVNTGLNIDGFRRDYRDGIILRCQSQAQGLKRSIESVLGLGIPLSELSGINERCQQIVRADPEIVYVLVEDFMGKPLYSSDPSFHSTQNVEFIAALNESTVLLRHPGHGKIYDVSEALYSSDGKLSGRIRLGFPESVLKQHTLKVFQRSVIILCVAFLIVFALIILFLKRDLIGPITCLCTVAKEIAGGHFPVHVPQLPTRDFNELGKALQEMAASLQEREERIQLNYLELEETNRELQHSYERQELISGELARSREMYRSLLEDASDAIVVSDEEDRIVLVNKAAEGFFGVGRERAEGRNLFTFYEMLNSDNLDVQYESHRRVLQGEAIESELCFVHPLEHRRVVGWLRGSPVIGKDGRRMVQSIIRDVTLEHEVRENLAKSTRELERLNQMKDSFLGVASHELKTPLTVIIGYSELLLGEINAKLDPSSRTMVQYIADAADRLSGIVRDMVDVSMLDGQRLRLRSRPIDLNEIVRRAADEMEYFISTRRQSIELRLNEVLPPVVCDQDRILQVLSNVIGNAIKFTPDGGCITVSTRVRRALRPFSAPPAECEFPLRPLSEVLLPYAEIVVRDTGIGIAENEQINVFEKFYEVGNIEEHFTGKVAFKGKGTGLGLTIVKGFVDLHGGEIWVESPGYDPKKCPGSEFHILLPLLPVSESSDRLMNVS